MRLRLITKLRPRPTIRIPIILPHPIPIVIRALPIVMTPDRLMTRVLPIRAVVPMVAGAVEIKNFQG